MLRCLMEWSTAALPHRGRIGSPTGLLCQLGHLALEPDQTVLRIGDIRYYPVQPVILKVYNCRLVLLGPGNQKEAVAYWFDCNLYCLLPDALSSGIEVVVCQRCLRCEVE